MKNKIKHKIITFYKFWLWVIKSFSQDNCANTAASLTLSSLLAIVPFLIVLFSILSAFSSFEGISGNIQHFIFQNFLPETGQSIGKYIDQILQNKHKLPAMSLIFLFVIIIVMISGLEKALNNIFKGTKKRKASNSFLLYWSVLTLVPLVLGGGLLISSYILSKNFIGGNADDVSWAISIFPFLLNVFGFTLIYIIVPNSKINLIPALIGGIFSATAFGIAKVVFAWYVTAFPTYAVIYGALSVIPLFILWVFISWQIFLIGALVTKGLHHSNALRTASNEHGLFMLCFRILQLALANKSIELADKHIYKEFSKVELFKIKSAINLLLSHNYLVRNPKGNICLTAKIYRANFDVFYKNINKYLPIDLENDNNFIKNIQKELKQALNKPIIDALQDNEINIK